MKFNWKPFASICGKIIWIIFIFSFKIIIVSIFNRQIIIVENNYPKTGTKVERILGEGYKIQLYYGSEQGAYGIKDKFNQLYPEIPAKLTFNTPDWKIQAGNYYTKLQADHDIVQFKIDFPGAIVIATDIDIAEN